MAMIDAQQVAYAYAAADGGESRLVLSDVDLTVEAGEFIALLGQNGSGKSTLAKHFNALLLPTGGRVLVEGMDTAEDSKKYDIRRTVGMVLQNPDNQLVSTVVEEDVAFGPENLGVLPEEIRRRVEQSLKAVGMWEYRAYAPHKLSGGQKQRVAIAGVLAMQPDCIVLDEATAMLDPKGRREVMDTVHTLNRDAGITVILITHYMEEAAEADRVAVLSNGRLVMDDVPRCVFSHVEQLREWHLDVPQPTALCYQLRAAGVPLPEDVLTVDECVAAITAAWGR